MNQWANKQTASHKAIIKGPAPTKEQAHYLVPPRFACGGAAAVALAEEAATLPTAVCGDMAPLFTMHMIAWVDRPDGDDGAGAMVVGAAPG
jgi:hypothetical protein